MPYHGVPSAAAAVKREVKAGVSDSGGGSTSGIKLAAEIATLKVVGDATTAAEKKG